MKQGFLILLAALAITANAQKKQSLKDLLYSGKLKLDSTSVIRKDDDLEAHIDTATRKPEMTPKPQEATAAPLATVNSSATNPTSVTPPTEVAETVADTAAKVAVPMKSTTKIWKEYSDSLISGLKTDVLTSKKIKKDSYFVMVEYEVAPDGSVTVGNVTSSPESPLLQSEIKQRMEINPPRLNPLPDTNKGRKVKKKYSFTVIKE